METARVIVVVAVILFGAFLQGVTGYGFSVVALPVTAWVFPHDVPQVLVFLGSPLTIAMAITERSAIDRGAVFGISAGQAVGTAIGIVVLDQMPARTLRLVLAITCVSVTVLPFVIHRAMRLSASRYFGAGVASGAMSVVAGMGGPPLALLYSLREGSQTRAGVSASSLFGNALAIAGLIAADHVGIKDLRLTAELAPAGVLGFIVACRSRGNISPRKLRYVGAVIMLFGSFALLVSSL